MKVKQFCAAFLALVLMAEPMVPAAQAETSFTPHISAQIGMVVTAPERSSSKNLILIQDAHDSIAAQKNIAAIIQSLVEKQDVKTVYEEGYEGPVPVDDFFGKFSGPGKQRAAEFALRNMEIGGAEYARVFNSNFELIGADNFQLHLSNVHAYARASKAGPEILGQIREWREINRHALEKAGGKEMAQWLETWRRYHDGHLPAEVYWKRLYDHAKKNRLNSVTSNSVIRVLAGAKNENTQILSNLSAETLLELQETWEKELARVLLHEDHQPLWQLEKYLELCEKLATLRISLTEYRVYQNLKKVIQLGVATDDLFAVLKNPLVLSQKWIQQLSAAEEFYEIALKRDVYAEKALDAFMQSGQDRAVMVFGGFHAEAIRQSALRRGVGVWVLRPRIQEISEIEKKEYVRRMASEMSRAISGFQQALRSPALGMEWRSQLARVAGEENELVMRAEIRELPADLIAAMETALTTGQNLPEDARLAIQRHFMENIRDQAKQLGFITGNFDGDDLDLPQNVNYHRYSLHELIAVPKQTMKAWIRGKTARAAKDPAPLTRYTAIQLAVLLENPQGFVSWVRDSGRSFSKPPQANYFSVVPTWMGYAPADKAGYNFRQIVALVFEPTETINTKNIKLLDPIEDWGSILGQNDGLKTADARLLRFRQNIKAVMKEREKSGNDFQPSQFAIEGGFLPGFYSRWVDQEEDGPIPISYREARELAYAVLRLEFSGKSAGADLERFKILFGDKNITLSEVKQLFGGSDPSDAEPPAASAAQSELSFPTTLKELNTIKLTQPDADDWGDLDDQEWQEEAGLKLNQVFLQNIGKLADYYSGKGKASGKEPFVTSGKRHASTTFVKAVTNIIHVWTLNFLVFEKGNQEALQKRRINRRMAIDLARFFTQLVPEVSSWSDELLLGYFIGNDDLTKAQMELIFKVGQDKAKDPKPKPDSKTSAKPRPKIQWPPLQEQLGWETAKQQIQPIDSSLIDQRSSLAADKSVQTKFNQAFLDNAYRLAQKKGYMVPGHTGTVHKEFVNAVVGDDQLGIGAYMIGWVLGREFISGDDEADYRKKVAKVRISDFDAIRVARKLIENEIPGKMDYDYLRILLGDNSDSFQITDEELKLIFAPKDLDAARARLSAREAKKRGELRAELRSTNVKTIVRMRISALDLLSRDFAEEVIALKKDKGPTLELSIEGIPQNRDIYLMLTKAGVQFVGEAVSQHDTRMKFVSKQRGWLLQRGGGFVYSGKGSLFAAYEWAGNSDVPGLRRVGKLFFASDVTRLLFAQFFAAYIVRLSA